MTWILTTEDIHTGNRQIVGGKGFALSQLVKAGFPVPNTLCITCDAYHDYVNRSGLRERILLEINRKDFKEMRWEEIWDCATRIRNMFLTVGLPSDLTQTIRAKIQAKFRDKPVAVRSSAPDEDTRQSSFAGLHESFINVCGADDIIKYLRLVWASLWSDAALLYRQEIGLDAEKSAMAVVIQESIAGEKSGVVFTRNPNDESQAILESVYGLNIEKFGDLSCAVTGGTECLLGTGPLFKLIVEMASHPPQAIDPSKVDQNSQLIQKYLAGFDADQQSYLEDLGYNVSTN